MNYRTAAMLGLWVALRSHAALPQAAPVPQPEPIKADTRVGVYIFPGYESPFFPNSEWDRCAKFAKPRPLLGFYDEALPEVNDWHVKWALEAGVSWFAWDWYWHSGEKKLHRSLEDGFLKARYSRLMDFCIHWCNHPVRSWPPVDNSPAGVAAVIEYCAKTYFTLPNYLKIGNRPVFMVWRIEDILKACGGADAFKRDVRPRLNAICHARGLGDLFLVIVNNVPGRVAKLPVGDAFTGYSYAGVTTVTPWSRPGWAPYSEMVDALPRLWRALHRVDKPFITSTQAGWDNTPRSVAFGPQAAKGRWVRTGNTAAEFERSLREGKKQVKAGLPFFLIEAWNEWGEGSHIEPSKEFGFSQLEAVRRVFAPGAPPPKWDVPPPEQIASYNLLPSDRLAAARERESQPDPPLPVPDWPLDLAVDPTPEPAGTVIATLSLSQVDRGAPQVHAMAGVDGPQGAAAFDITGSDPWLWWRGDWAKAMPGLRVCLRLRYEAGSALFAARTAQLFYAADSETLSEDRSRRFPVIADGDFHTYVLTFRPDRNWHGRLKQLRFDPTSGPGSRIEIERAWIVAP